MTDRLQQGDAKALSLVLRRAFDPLKRTWYSPETIRRHRDIGAYYLDRFFAGKRGASKDEAAKAKRLFAMQKLSRVQALSP